MFFFFSGAIIYFYNRCDLLKAQPFLVVCKAQSFTLHCEVHSECATPAAAHAGFNEDISKVCTFPAVPHA